MGEDGQLSDAALAELAALADGSLPPAARVLASARVESSPRLQALVDEQRVAIAAIESLDVRSPAGLRARIEAARSKPKPRKRSARFALAGGFAAALAAAALAVVVVAGSGAPSIEETADLARRGPSEPAPSAYGADPNLLAASVAGVSFPNYEEMFGWRASGQRSDDLDGRQTGTVFYARDGSEIAYSIVSGERLEWPAGAKQTTREGIELRSFERDGSTVVTWLRDGHTCVLSGAGVPREELLELAAWMGDGSVSF